MITQRHQIGSVVDDLLVERRGQPGSAGGVLRVDDHAVNLVPRDHNGQRLAQDAPPGSAHDISDAKKPKLHAGPTAFAERRLDALTGEGNRAHFAEDRHADFAGVGHLLFDFFGHIT